jgi:predicted nucleotidyltransferase
MSTGELIGAYIFGSVGRGQYDDQSDLDILAVVRNGRGKVPESYIISHIPEKLKSLKLSISWYGGNRLQEMFRNGELFAWHLHRETIPLIDPNKFLASLGHPSQYRDCVADVASFRKILIGIPSQIVKNENNAIYEAGLIYVCLRNIAMAASWALCEFPNFSRHSPFKLAGIAPCPISPEEFELTMACRMASQRGLDPAQCVTRAFVLDAFERLDPWVSELIHVLQRKVERGRECQTYSF